MTLPNNVVERTQMLARATDTLEAPALGANYEATFHDLVKGVALVFAPCGCKLAVGSSGDSLVTICAKAECTFDWKDAETAYRLLVRPEPVIDIKSIAVASAPEGGPVEANVEEIT